MKRYEMQNNLIKLLRDRYHVQIIEEEKNYYVPITDFLSRNVPLDVLSKNYAGRGSRLKRIKLIEMIETILTTNPKDRRYTTKPNMYELVYFFNACDRVSFDPITFEVTDIEGIFRDEDKFAFRTIEKLKNIFPVPGFKECIHTQKHIESLMERYVPDIYLDLTPYKKLCIEFDEKHHRRTSLKRSDKPKREILSMIYDLRIFNPERHDFDIFLSSICTDIVRLNNNKEQKEKYITHLILHNFKKNTGDVINVETVVTMLNIRKTQVVDIDILANHILYENDIDEAKRINEAKRIKTIKSCIQTCIKNKTMDNEHIEYSKDKKIIGIKNTGLAYFLMLYNKPVANNFRKTYDSIVSEYIKLMENDDMQFRIECTPEDKLDRLQDTFDFHCGQDQISIKHIPPNTVSRGRKVYKAKKIIGSKNNDSDSSDTDDDAVYNSNIKALEELKELKSCFKENGHKPKKKHTEIISELNTDPSDQEEEDIDDV